VVMAPAIRLARDGFAVDAHYRRLAQQRAPVLRRSPDDAWALHHLGLLAERSGSYISRGISVPGIDRARKWEFTPAVKAGDRVVINPSPRVKDGSRIKSADR